jgi:hypothetical protein
MQDDIKLLPLPEWMSSYTIPDDGFECDGQVVLIDRMRDYARANVKHHTEALRAEVKRLQEIVRPKREDECLTLDHWRMRAYALEANWSRCSHACAVEQDKREQAEARAERLEEALAELISWVPSTAVYRSLGFDTEALVRALEKARAALAREGER